MNVCIIVFSPSGHTLQAGQMLQTALLDQSISADLINITRQAEVFTNNNIAAFLRNNVPRHDLLCIGGPVYAGHLESNVHRLIKSLPPPDDNHWGRLAIPFVTYGGLHSSVALQEAGNLLHAASRINIMGIKMASFHSLSHNLQPAKINEGKPGPEEKAVAVEAVYRLKHLLQQNKFPDIRHSFAYASQTHKLILHFFSQNYFHAKYRTVRADPAKCNGCGSCQQRCPVNLIQIIAGKAVRINNGHVCLLCAECYHHCPRKAVIHDFVEQKISQKLNREKEKYHENPPSAVYPLMGSD